MLTFNFKKYELNKEGSMLDVGCGEGRHIFGVMQEFPKMKCVGLDMDNDSLKKAEEGYEYFESISDVGAEFMKGSAYSLPFSDDTFDLIVCSEVLEHLHEYNNAVVEINRVLKPGGKFFASVPASWPEKVCWYLSKDYQNQPGGHLRIFNQRKLIREIEDCGFKFLSSEKFHSIHSPYWWLRCLLGVKKDKVFAVRHYHKLLVAEMMNPNGLVATFGKLLDPIMGKSVVYYFDKK